MATRGAIFVRQEGLSQTLAMLRTLDKATAPTNVLRGSLRYSAVPLVKDLERTAPYSLEGDVDDYHLRDHMGLFLERKGKRRTAAQFRVGPGRVVSTDPESGYRIAGGLRKNSLKTANYASLVHDDNPFMQRSIARQRAAVVGRFAKRSRELTLKAIKRQQRTQGKAA